MLHAFMMRHLHSIMRITWMDKVSNKDILDRKGLPSMDDLLIRKNVQWTRHLMKMTPDRLAKQILNCFLITERALKNLKLRDIKTDSWTSLSQQRDKWRAIVKG
ncbi:hypothetical protein NP493_1226g00004 [Ridgeia piscesae]|uniref:Uncharacterized protein n=1 Tax=Ridgeia piscesae TaxID=27915 RepID=A0AAD9KD85_RIDPI|nr:hypothetical protein NP493_1226g00004 [Ridgeia piscesae]